VFEPPPLLFPLDVFLSGVFFLKEVSLLAKPAVRDIKTLPCAQAVESSVFFLGSDFLPVPQTFF